MKQVIRTVLLVSFIFSCKIAFSQQNISAYESQLVKLQSKADSLQRRLAILQWQMDSLSVEITSLKKKADLSYLERKQLERYLQAAQSNATAQERIISEQNNIQKEIEIVAKTLFQFFDHAIDSLMMVMDRSAKKDENSKQKLRMQIDFYRMRQEQLPLASDFGKSHHSTKLMIAPEDMPEVIQAKAGYLRDQRDKLLRHAVELEERMRQLRQEITLRKKMAEFLADMQLFDQRDEAFSFNAKSVESFRATDKRIPNAGLNTPNSETEKAQIVSPLEKLLPNDMRNMSDDSVEEYLSSLQTQRQRLLFQADSLEALAQKYDDRAKNMHRHLLQPQ